MCDIRDFKESHTNVCSACLVSQKKVIANLRLDIASSVLKKCLTHHSGEFGGGKPDNFCGMAEFKLPT